MTANVIDKPSAELGNFLDVGRHNPYPMGRFSLRRGGVPVPALTVQKVL